MWRVWIVTLATHLVLPQADGERGNTLLTVPQRDVLRSRTDPASTGVSADGHYVAFVSYARLVTADTNDRADIYVLNRRTGEVTLESVDEEGAPLRGTSGFPRLSADGRYLTFDSAVHDEAGQPTVQVLLRDRTARTTTWIGRGSKGRFPNGWCREPAISADGRIVVFTSSATDLVPGVDGNGLRSDVYTYAVASGRLERVSVDTSGAQPSNGYSHAPSVSADGRHVAFVSTADLGFRVRDRSAGPGSRPFGHIYVRDLLAGVTTHISESRTGQPGNGGSWGPAVSGDGRFVAFASAAGNLVDGDRNRMADVFLYDRSTGLTTLVSRSARRGAANGGSLNPAISHDGRFVAFQSDASDLLCARRCRREEEDINLVYDVFLFDRSTLRTRRISGTRGGWMEESGGPAMSADARIVAFSSRHPIDASDEGGDFDLFVAVAGEGEQEIRRSGEAGGATRDQETRRARRARRPGGATGRQETTGARRSFVVEDPFDSRARGLPARPMTASVNGSVTPELSAMQPDAAGIAPIECLPEPASFASH